MPDNAENKVIDSVAIIHFILITIKTRNYHGRKRNSTK